MFYWLEIGMNKSGDDLKDWMQAGNASRFGEGLLASAQRVRRCTTFFMCLHYLWQVAADLRKGFDGLLEDPGRYGFEFKGLEMLRGSKL
jgi:hypothetical protein